MQRILISSSVTKERSVCIRAVARWARADRDRISGAGELINQFMSRNRDVGWRDAAKCKTAKLVHAKVFYPDRLCGLGNMQADRSRQDDRNGVMGE